jgi:tRNA dimethylallyltransferase
MPSVGDEKPPVVVILGPTASGKSALAMRFAREFDGAIVSADSRQVYRFMDIGTAKPSLEERTAITHCLIDIVAPDEVYSLAQYQTDAYAALDDVTRSGRLPLLVGGTGQYLTAVIEGWGIPTVPPNPAARAALEAFARQHGTLALHARLETVDPAAAARIDHRNVRRVVRALEVFEETGTPISVLQQRTPPPYRFIQIGLTMPRDRLYRRIDERVESMAASGLEGEVRGLLERGYTWDCPAMSGLGYAQWRPYLAGLATLDDTLTAIRHATHAFARRQYTWFHGHDTGVTWFDMALDSQDAVSDAVRKQLSASKD